LFTVTVKQKTSGQQYTNLWALRWRTACDTDRLCSLIRSWLYSVGWIN